MLAIRLSVLVAAAASPGVLAAQNAPTISGDSIKVGVVTDLSGVNLDYGGPTAVVAAQMAAEDLGGKIRGKPIKILALDHLNKADIASQKVREWFDQEGVGMVTELLNSGVALAVSKVAAEKNGLPWWSAQQRRASPTKIVTPTRCITPLTPMHWVMAPRKL
jgi:branched-chain amino acid transport system substrate-binding protein